jgi:hypothetical protein
MVPAPPPDGHRSKLDGEAERRRLQAIDAGMIEGVIEKAKRCLSTGDSP